MQNCDGLGWTDKRIDRQMELLAALKTKGNINSMKWMNTDHVLEEYVQSAMVLTANIKVHVFMSKQQFGCCFSKDFFSFSHI